MSDSNNKIRIIILNYNGKELLEECLPSISEASKQSRYSCKITVLDNVSSDESKSFVKRNYPEVEFVISPKNRVFCSYNAYVASLDEEYVILLNNDILVDARFIDPLIDALRENNGAFFAAPKTLNVNTKAYEGCLAKLGFRWGLIWGSSTFEDYQKLIDDKNISMQCGFGAFKRKNFVQNGGFDDLYLPGTIEDSDFAFRGYRKGWKGYYSPQSIVYHMGQVSFKKAFGTGGIKRINRRNMFLFVWKNIRSKRLLMEHVLCIPLHLIKYLIKGEFSFILGFFDALRLMPEALKRRRRNSAEPSIVADKDIFALSESIK